MIEKCLGYLQKLNEEHQIRSVCRDNLVYLKKPNGEMVSIYDGSSRGYKSDYKFDVAGRVLEEIQGEKDDCKLILRPNAVVKKNFDFDEKILPIRIVPLKLRKH